MRSVGASPMFANWGPRCFLQAVQNISCLKQYAVRNPVAALKTDYADERFRARKPGFIPAAFSGFTQTESNLKYFRMIGFQINFGVLAHAAGRIHQHKVARFK
jgi:hypothetical protein